MYLYTVHTLRLVQYAHTVLQCMIMMSHIET